MGQGRESGYRWRRGDRRERGPQEGNWVRCRGGLRSRACFVAALERAHFPVPERGEEGRRDSLTHTYTHHRIKPLSALWGHGGSQRGPWPWFAMLRACVHHRLRQRRSLPPLCLRCPSFPFCFSVYDCVWHLKLKVYFSATFTSVFVIPVVWLHFEDRCEGIWSA